MSKLLNANFYRLKKNKVFWILLVVMFVSGFYLYANYNGFDGKMLENCTGCENQTSFFGYLEAVWLLLPIIVCLFVGTEYSDGTIRNKIMIGHKKTSIYISNLITCVIVDLLLCLSFIISVSIMEFMMVNDASMTLTKFGFLFLDSILLSLVFTSIFNFLSMIISNKTSSSICSFVIVVWSMMIEGTLHQKLIASTGATSHFYQILSDVLPYSHLTQILRLTDRYIILCCVSLVLLIVINFYGIMYFKNKEIN